MFFHQKFQTLVKCRYNHDVRDTSILKDYYTDQVVNLLQRETNGDVNRLTRVVTRSDVCIILTEKPVHQSMLVWSSYSSCCSEISRIKKLKSPSLQGMRQTNIETIVAGSVNWCLMSADMRTQDLKTSIRDKSVNGAWWLIAKHELPETWRHDSSHGAVSANLTRDPALHIALVCFANCGKRYRHTTVIIMPQSNSSYQAKDSSNEHTVTAFKAERPENYISLKCCLTVSRGSSTIPSLMAL